MFDRYTEPARRVVFWARLEASGFGASEIDTEHLLIGLLREAPHLPLQPFPTHLTADTVRASLRECRPALERVSTSVDMPLSESARRTLAFAEEESATPANAELGLKHLLLAIAREESCPAAAILRDHGLTLAVLREKFAG